MKCLVVEGVPFRDCLTIDTGKARTAADMLCFAELMPDASTLSTAVRIIWRFERGMIQLNAAAPTPEQVCECYSRHQNLRRFLSLGSKVVKSGIRGGAGTWAAIGYWIAQKNETGDADEFMARLAMGNNLDTGHPILTLRNKLLSTKKTKFRPVEIAAFAFKAWNALRAGSKMHVLRYQAGQDDFPFPIGNPEPGEGET